LGPPARKRRLKKKIWSLLHEEGGAKKKFWSLLHGEGGPKKNFGASCKKKEAPEKIFGASCTKKEALEKLREGRKKADNSPRNGVKSPSRSNNVS
jgi:hypothetical protein